MKLPRIWVKNFVFFGAKVEEMGNKSCARVFYYGEISLRQDENEMYVQQKFLFLEDNE